MNQLAFDFSPQGGEKIEKLLELVLDLKKYRLDIEAALAYGENSHDFDHIVGQVLQGRLHFYPLENSFIIMEVHKYPNFSVYHGFLAGGRLQEILDFQGQLEDNAKSLGCKGITISGRRGWEKVLKQRGWKHQLSHLVLEI